MDLFEILDQHMTRDRISLPQKMAFWPSMASVELTDSQSGYRWVEGKCMRASWYQYMTASGKLKIPEEDIVKPTPYNEWIWAIGKSVENMLVERFKQAGLWIANSIKYYDEEHNISAEIDCIVHDPIINKPIVCEIKSFYGYYAHKEIMGNKSTAGFPKWNNLLQLGVYLDYLTQHKIEIEGKPLDEGALLYMARDDISRIQYRVKVEDVRDEAERHIVVQDQRVINFTMKNIYDRYRALATYIDMNEIPPNDFVRKYDEDRIKFMYKIGKLSKTKYNEWEKKKKVPGDWQCGYCEWRKLCWGEDSEDEEQ